MNHNLGPTGTLASYAAGAKYADFPEAVKWMAKLCIADSIGCAYGGADTTTGRFVAGLTEELGGHPEVPILGDGRLVPAVVGGDVNAKLANVLDFDDTLIGHPGACVIHPALALAQKIGASGQQLTRAVALGYEWG